MPRFDDDTNARAQALIAALVSVGYLPTNGPIEWGEKLWEIVCTHIAQAEGKTI